MGGGRKLKKIREGRQRKENEKGKGWGGVGGNHHAFPPTFACLNLGNYSASPLGYSYSCRMDILGRSTISGYPAV